MTLDVVAVVEGRGEVEAVPVLLRRIVAVASLGLHPRVETIRRDPQAVVRSPDVDRVCKAADSCRAQMPYRLPRSSVTDW